MTSSELPPNELADRYEALSAVLNQLPSDTHPAWQTAIKAVLFGGEGLTAGVTCYGEQQAERNGFKLSEYRAQYGDGDRVKEFPAIEMTRPAKSDRQYVDESFRVPVTPESGTALPLVVDADTLPGAISLLNEFPVTPAADTPGDGGAQLLDPNQILEVSASSGDADDLSASEGSEQSSSEIPANELADLYDGLYALLERMPETAHPGWRTAVESVVFTGEYLRPKVRSYGTQQRERNDFGMPDYREQYGNGEHVTEFEVIQTADLLPDETHHDKGGITRPVAPESGVALPIAPTAEELSTALQLLNELPVAPQADLDSAGGESLLDVEAILADYSDLDQSAPSGDARSSRTTGDGSTDSDRTSSPTGDDVSVDTATVQTPEVEESGTKETTADSGDTTADTTVLRAETAGESTVPPSNQESSESTETRKYEDPEAERAHRQARQRDPSDVVELGEEITLILKEVDYSSRPPTVMGTKNSLKVFVTDAPQDLSKYDAIRVKVTDYGGTKTTAEAAFSDYVD
ncbi:hypothetical protein [Halobellus ruber]|uniref:TRAM domain-containing protein n=1 Tax=Halobellus ruber TaxID=2761102 RepID=A0A7J9SD86_9EURY|nr:hypothetical protein [Halobellus ruber]MBB6644884.1 hypothetical protein [Halobellus ruber]